MCTNEDEIAFKKIISPYKKIHVGNFLSCQNQEGLNFHFFDFLRDLNHANCIEMLNCVKLYAIYSPHTFATNKETMQRICGE